MSLISDVESLLPHQSFSHHSHEKDIDASLDSENQGQHDHTSSCEPSADARCSCHYSWLKELLVFPAMLAILFLGGLCTRSFITNWALEDNLVGRDIFPRKLKPLFGLNPALFGVLVGVPSLFIIIGIGYLIHKRCRKRKEEGNARRGERILRGPPWRPPGLPVAIPLTERTQPG